jgi:hypothetical protein
VESTAPVLGEGNVVTARVSSVEGLLDALEVASHIEVTGSGMPMITLRPGVRLHGGRLRFGSNGVRLTADNRLDDITVIVP